MVVRPKRLHIEQATLPLRRRMVQFHTLKPTRSGIYPLRGQPPMRGGPAC